MIDMTLTAQPAAIPAPGCAGPAATATARKLTDGTWHLEDEDWGTFTGPTLGAAYAAATAYRAANGDTSVLVVRLHRPGAPQDWQALERFGYLGDEPEPVLAEVTITPGDDTICGRCECPLPAGAPAWPAGDGVLCSDCAETES